MRLAFPGLASSLNDQSTVLTSSALLSAAVTQQFTDTQLEKGRLSWLRPSVHTAESWLVACWQEARYALPGIPVLLSPPQERLLWQIVIQQENPELFDVATTARMARDASRLAAEWNIPLQSEQWEDHLEGLHFLRWHAAFRAECSRRNCITREQLWNLVPSWIEKGVCRSNEALLVGFEQVSPALECVLSRPRRFTVLKPVERAFGVKDRVTLESCSDIHEEIEQSARWARAAFEADPTASLGVFIPDLRANRLYVQRTFRSVFYPSASLHLVSGSQPLNLAESIFHIDSPVPLEGHPLIASALLLAELGRERIEQANATAILRSPFVQGASAERSARALADLQLRRYRELDVDLHDLERASRDCKELVPVWSAVRNVCRNLKAKAELPVWSKFIGDLLQAVGWPGDVDLPPEEQDLIEVWNDALSGLSALGLVAEPVSYSGALRHLRSLLQTNGPQTGDWSSPIQILEAQSASGLSFDRAFLTGLSDGNWPPSQRMQPLIPLALQRAHNVPYTTPSALLSERERLTRALFSVAPSVTGTFSGRLSPLTSSYAEAGEKSLTGWSGKLPVQSFAPVGLDEIEDSMAPPFDTTHAARGGTSVIKLQSQCPFRAFAEIRLRAQTPDDASFGYDSRDRGGFLHKALEFVWKELRTRDALCATPADKLEALVRDAVTRAVREDDASGFHVLAAEIERERLEMLVLDWLNTVEKNRPGPFTVEWIEDELVYDLAGLPLRLRIDRIDRLKNGRMLLFDYKSGTQTRGKLDCPRPVEPQLLVYAAAKGSEVDGLFFGVVKPRELRVVGYSHDKHVTSKSVTVKKGNDWDAFVEKARNEVFKLAGDFLRGDALVDPCKGACEYCSVKPFCRVNERPVSTTAAEDEA